MPRLLDRAARALDGDPSVNLAWDAETMWKVRMHKDPQGRGIFTAIYVRASSKEEAMRKAAQQAKGSDYPYTSSAKRVEGEGEGEGWSGQRDAKVRAGDARDGYRLIAKSGSIELLENDAYSPSKWFTKGPGGIEEHKDEREARKEYRWLSSEYSRDAKVRAGDPLTPKGSEIMRAMQEQYGNKKGKEVFYASANKGTITGVHDRVEAIERKNAEATLKKYEDLERRGGGKIDAAEKKRAEAIVRKYEDLDRRAAAFASSLDCAASSLAAYDDLPYNPKTQGRTYKITYGGGKNIYVVATDPKAAVKAFRLERDEPIEALRDYGVRSEDSQDDVFKVSREGDYWRVKAGPDEVTIPVREASTEGAAKEQALKKFTARYRADPRDSRLARAADALRGHARDEEFNKGEVIHLGFGSRGGAGFYGVVTENDGRIVRIRNSAGKEYSGPVRFASKATREEMEQYAGKDRRGARDVSKPDRPNPTTAEPLRKAPTRIRPPTAVSGFFAESRKQGDPAYRGSGGLPDRVSAREEWDGANSRINY